MRRDYYDDATRVIRAAVRFGFSELCQPVRAADAANEAGYSEFHFQRLFHAMAGESWAAFHRRLRLEAAAVRLQSTCEPVFAVAIRAGFEGSEPFVRAFRQAYGVPPGVFRRTRKERPLLPTPNGVHAFDPDSAGYFRPLRRGEYPPDFEIVAVPEVRVIAMEHRGALQFISEAWRRLADWAAAREITLDERTLLTFAEDLDEDTPPERQVGFVALDDRGEDGLLRMSVGGGSYLTARHLGSGHLLADFWFRVYGEAV